MQWTTCKCSEATTKFLPPTPTARTGRNILIERSMCERVFVINVSIHTDMLRNQTQEKTYIVIVAVCVLT